MRNLAIFDPLSIDAQEVRRKLELKRHLWHELKLLSTNPDEDGSLTESDGAAALVQAYESGALETTDLVFAPGSDFDTISSDLLPSTRTILLGSGPEGASSIVYGVNHDRAEGTTTVVSPEASVVALGHIARPLRDLGLRRLSATTIYPVSSRGGAALDELFDQTRQLLNFNPNPTTPQLDHQVAFNVIPDPTRQYRAERQLAEVLGSATETGLAVSIQTLLGGVFHGVSISVFLEFDEDPGEGAILEMLEESDYLEIVEEPSHLGPIDAADREEILLGELASSGPAGSYRLWGVFDNLTRGGASNAVDLAEWLLAS